MRKRKRTVYNGCCFVSGTVTGSTILQGNSGNTNAANGGDVLTDLEREAVRLIRSLPMRQRVAWMQAGYSLEDMTA